MRRHRHAVDSVMVASQHREYTERIVRGRGILATGAVPVGQPARRDESGGRRDLDSRPSALKAVPPRRIGNHQRPRTSGQADAASGSIVTMAFGVHPVHGLPGPRGCSDKAPPARRGGGALESDTSRLQP